MMLKGFLYFLMVIGFLGNAAGTEPTRVLLLGDSSVITAYLPADQACHREIQRQLEALKSGAEIEVVNTAVNPANKTP